MIRGAEPASSGPVLLLLLFVPFLLPRFGITVAALVGPVMLRPFGPVVIDPVTVAGPVAASPRAVLIGLPGRARARVCAGAVRAPDCTRDPEGAIRLSAGSWSFRTGPAQREAARAAAASFEPILSYFPETQDDCRN